jgi:TPR repeat protein
MDGLPGDASESRIEAYKWLRLAADQGYAASEAACECLALLMTLESVTDATRRAAEFVAGPEAA